MKLVATQLPAVEVEISLIEGLNENSGHEVSQAKTTLEITQDKQAPSQTPSCNQSHFTNLVSSNRLQRHVVVTWKRQVERVYSSPISNIQHPTNTAC